MEPAGGMTEVFRKNKRGVAAKPSTQCAAIHPYTYISNVITNIISKFL